MVLTDLYKIFEKRKQNMQDLLNNGHSIALEKKHEIQGAVCEIDIFLKTIEHFQNLPKVEDIKLDSAPEEKKGFFSRLRKK